jgi:hypothetical protein
VCHVYLACVCRTSKWREFGSLVPIGLIVWLPMPRKVAAFDLACERRCHIIRVDVRFGLNRNQYDFLVLMTALVTCRSVGGDRQIAWRLIGSCPSLMFSKSSNIRANTSRDSFNAKPSFGEDLLEPRLNVALPGHLAVDPDLVAALELTAADVEQRLLLVIDDRRVERQRLYDALPVVRGLARSRPVADCKMALLARRCRPVPRTIGIRQERDEHRFEQLHTAKPDQIATGADEDVLDPLVFLVLFGRHRYSAFRPELEIVLVVVGRVIWIIELTPTYSRSFGRLSAMSSSDRKIALSIK